MTHVQIFKALGDPVRLEIVHRLSGGESYTLSSVSKGLNISRQGVRKHLQVLSDADVIQLETHGRDTAVRLNVDSLERCKAFINELETRWERRLEALRRYVEENE